MGKWWRFQKTALSRASRQHKRPPGSLHRCIRTSSPPEAHGRQGPFLVQHRRTSKQNHLEKSNKILLLSGRRRWQHHRNARYGAPFAEQSKAKPQRAQLTGPHVNKQAPSEKLAHGKSWAPPRHRSGTPWRAPGCHALVPTGQPRDACTSPGDLRGHGFSGQVPFAPARVWTSVF